MRPEASQLRPVRACPDGTFSGGDDVGCGVGKAEHVLPLLPGQAGDALFQKKTQHAGAEGIPRSGGFGGSTQGKGRNIHRFLIGVKAVVAANGRGFGNGSGGSSGGRGAQTINGLGMLVNQAALNFKIWTGVDAPMDVMKQTLMNEFGL